MFNEMNKKERRKHMIASLDVLKRIREYDGPHGLAAGYAKHAHEARFRKLWANRHNEEFNFNQH
jgi:hypothetical protein